MWGQFSLTKRPDDLPFDVIKGVLSDFSRNRSFTRLWTVASGGTDQALPRSGEDQPDRVRLRRGLGIQCGPFEGPAHRAWSPLRPGAAWPRAIGSLCRPHDAKFKGFAPELPSMRNIGLARSEIQCE